MLVALSLAPPQPYGFGIVNPARALSAPESGQPFWWWLGGGAVVAAGAVLWWCLRRRG